METLDLVAMENSEAVNGSVGLLTDVLVLSSNSFKGSEIIGNESALYEKFLLDDLDNYWDELNDRLTVSRMVSDSVIKGMVHAVADEAAEEIAKKDKEIAILSKKLMSYESNAATDSVSSQSLLQHSSVHSGEECNYSENLGKLRITTEKQLQRLQKDIHDVRNSNSNRRTNYSSVDVDVGLCPQARTTEKWVEIDESIDALRVSVAAAFKEINSILHSMNSSVIEQKWKHDYQREISAIIVQDCVRGPQEEFETNFFEQRSLINELNMNWKEKIAQLSAMREDLDALSRSLLSSELDSSFYNSLDSFEEWNTAKRKDPFPRKVAGHHLFPCKSLNEENGNFLMMKSEDDGKHMLEVGDFSHLRHMRKEEVIGYFKDEVIKMRRQHDSALQEKTEELFILKREFLKEKGSSHFRKDKEFEVLKKKIPEIILKLDDILLEKEKLPSVQNDHDDLCSLKRRIDALSSDNQHLRGLLAEKKKAVKCLSSQVSDAASQMSLHSTAETKFLKQIKKLKGNLEDAKIEMSLRDGLYGIVLKDVLGGYRWGMEDSEIKSKIMLDIHSISVSMFVNDMKSTTNSMMLKHFTEKSSLEALLFQNEKALLLEVEENEKLKQVITLLSTMMKEKEKIASEAGSTLMKQKEQFDPLNRELNMLRDQVTKQATLISRYKLESESAKSRLDRTLQQIHQYEMEVKQLNKKLVFASNALEEAEKQKTMLHGIIEDKENKIVSSVTKNNQQVEQMNSIINSVLQLSKTFTDCESKLTENIQRSESRLNILSRQCSPLVQQANLLMKKGLWYKQMLDTRYSNLQKAEAEVDLLGDEVDALLSVLGKIYIALDHYSPVLQHYPGVMEILKLVRRELEGETTKLM